MPLTEGQRGLKSRCQRVTEKIQAQPLLQSLGTMKAAPFPVATLAPALWEQRPHPTLPPPMGLTMFGSPLSAAEALRDDLFCGPVGTAMRKQQLKSRTVGGHRWASVLSQTWGQARLGLETSRVPAPAKRCPWEGSGARKATLPLPGRMVGGWGKGER